MESTIRAVPAARVILRPRSISRPRTASLPRTGNSEPALPVTAPLQGSSPPRKRTASEITGQVIDRDDYKKQQTKKEIMDATTKESVDDPVDDNHSGRVTGVSSDGSYDGATLTRTTNGGNNHESNIFAFDYPNTATAFQRPSSPTPSKSSGFPRDENWPLSRQGNNADRCAGSSSSTSNQTKYEQRNDGNKKANKHGANVPYLARIAGRNGHEQHQRGRGGAGEESAHGSSGFFGGHFHPPSVESGRFHFRQHMPQGRELLRSIRKSQRAKILNAQGSVHMVQHVEPTTDMNSVRSRTQSVLNDSRTPSRFGNRTGLEVQLPNGISPINEEVFDAGCGRTVHSSSRSAGNRFRSPASPAVISVHAVQTGPGAPSPFGNALSTSSSATIKKLYLLSQKRGWWIVGVGGTIVAISFITSVTSIAVKSHENDLIVAGDIIWLSTSVFGLVFIMITVNCLVARREHMKIHQGGNNGRNDEEWIEMRTPLRALPQPPQAHLAGNNNVYRAGGHVPPIEDEIAHRAILRRTDQQAQDAAWGQFASNDARVRRYIMFLEDRVDLDNEQRQIAAATEAAEEESIIEEPLVEEQQLYQNSIRASTIGVARSTSLYESEQKKKEKYKATLPKTPSEASIAAHEELSPIPFWQKETPMQATAVNESDAGSTMTGSSKEAFTIASEYDQVDMASNCASDCEALAPNAVNVNVDSVSIAPSATATTLSSLVGGYANNFDSSPQKKPGMYSPLSASASTGSLHPDGLRSHPITTEAGTPNSQKGVERYSSFIPRRSWSYKDEVRSRKDIRDMTPIKERGSDATVSPVA